jgi:hypothetical protein
MTSSPTPAPEPAADEGLDRLLRDYFRSKLPRTFPPLPIDSAGPVRPRRQPRSNLSRGRLILAACVVAVVVGFGYLLSIAPLAGQKPVGIGGDNSATNVKPHEAPAKR